LLSCQHDAGLFFLTSYRVELFQGFLTGAKCAAFSAYGLNGHNLARITLGFSEVSMYETPENQPGMVVSAMPGWLHAVLLFLRLLLLKRKRAWHWPGPLF